MKNNQFCVYTALLGNYEELNEQPVALKSDVDFICFTDNKELTSKTWKIIQVDPVFPLDPIRSSRMIKICPQRFLPNYDISLYIDNSVTLKVIPENIFEELMSEDYDLVCMKHSFRNTVLDEFEEVLHLQFDNLNIILEQLNAYSLINPEIFSQKPCWGGFLIRKHNKKIVKDAMEDWLAQVMRYSRRDQLSLNYIISKYKLNIKKLDLDNQSTIYHQWPTSTRYGQQSIKSTLTTSIENNMRSRYLEKKVSENEQTIQTLTAHIAEKEQEVQNLGAKVTEKESIAQMLTNQLNQTQNELIMTKQEVLKYALSKSWRITRPLRKITQFLKGKRNA